MCGHGIIAVTTMALERGLIIAAAETAPPASDRRLRQTAAPVRTTVEAVARAPGASRRRRPRRVACFVNVPSFVLRGGAARAGRRPQIRGRRRLWRRLLRHRRRRGGGRAGRCRAPPELRRLGMAIAREVERLRTVVHPLEPGLNGIYGTIFTAPPQVPRRAPAQRDDLRRRRSRSLAVRHRHRGGDGRARRDGAARATMCRSCTRASSARRSAGVWSSAAVGDLAPIVPEIEGSAWITGEHTFLIDGDDPLKARLQALK